MLSLGIKHGSKIVVRHGGETLILTVKLDQQGRTRMLCDGPRSFQILREVVAERERKEAT